MRVALLKARSLDSLAPNELTLLAELFNLPPPADYEQGLGALKQVISGIILVERYSSIHPETTWKSTSGSPSSENCPSTPAQS